ncbi:S-adenosyl-L-methionine-dependent methyltransferase [Lentinula aciculospora]|uniref:Ubiquinone biosynthesis O-methyltransferase, mitochondrial n=1 Tax=Lentinula aciculospora TaxID=153920 RepID=A0A9W8ZXF0_9AGAR|nr:S-adenosyl-L-methionine-dependent methyltransferase [Lentinula aciculospora]
MFPTRLLRSSTVNASEIAHFSRLSAEWWNERGEFSFLHKMNPVRMQFIREKLIETAYDEQPEEAVDAKKVRILEGLDVLDVGCGGGLLSESLARLGAWTTGIDASESNVAIAQHHASLDSRVNSNLTYKHAPAESLLSQSKRYDVVCSMEVLEHVDNPVMFLKTCAELLKPSGHLFLSTISRTPLSYFLTIFMAEKVFREVADGTHTYSKYIKPSELLEFFQSYRSQLPSSVNGDGAQGQSRPWITRLYNGEPTRKEAEVRGMIYNPLSASWILAPRGAWGAAECNYLFWVRKPILDDIL